MSLVVCVCCVFLCWRACVFSFRVFVCLWRACLFDFLFVYSRVCVFVRMCRCVLVCAVLVCVVCILCVCGRCGSILCVLPIWCLWVCAFVIVRRLAGFCVFVVCLSACAFVC